MPLGVIGIIYESRPNVTADAGGLCLKSGNAASCAADPTASTPPAPSSPACRTASKAAGLPEAAIQLVPTTDRAAVGIMLTMTDDIDVIVPRGGQSLIQRVQRKAGSR